MMPIPTSASDYSGSILSLISSPFLFDRDSPPYTGFISIWIVSIRKVFMNRSHSGNSAGCVRIGVVGTAKNTGKTTTLVALMQQATLEHVSLAVTSIGYDGEAIDNLTLLPKPRLDVTEGIVIGTAEQCARQATMEYRLIDELPMTTSLGGIKLIRSLSDGRILLAGPNKTDALESVLKAMQGLASLIFIDGALGRMVPMSAADAVIITTGASRSTHIPHLARETRAIHDIFTLHGLKIASPLSQMPENVTLFYHKGEKKTLAFSSLLGQEEAETIAACVNPDLTGIAVPGAVALHSLKAFLEKNRASLSNVAFYFHSPPMLLAGGKPLAVWENLKTLDQRGANAVYHKPLPIIAVTINPFYPRQIGRRGMFEADYVDKEELYREFSETLDVPVFNIKRKGVEDLFRLIQNF